MQCLLKTAAVELICNNLLTRGTEVEGWVIKLEPVAEHKEDRSSIPLAWNRKHPMASCVTATIQSTCSIELT